MPSPLVVRRVLMTGAVVGVTITGTLYGAGIKMDREVKQETRKRETATLDEKIQALEARRKKLVAAKEGFEKQIGTLEEKMGKRAEQVRQQQLGAGQAQSQSQSQSQSGTQQQQQPPGQGQAPGPGSGQKRGE